MSEKKDIKNDIQINLPLNMKKQQQLNKNQQNENYEKLIPCSENKENYIIFKNTNPKKIRKKNTKYSYIFTRK